MAPLTAQVRTARTWSYPADAASQRAGRLEADTLTIRFGHRAADILDKLVPEPDYETAQVAALIVASVVGHPRGSEPGEPCEFVWSDHLALVTGISLRTAFEISDVKTRQPSWLKALEGQVRLVAGDRNR